MSDEMVQFDGTPEEMFEALFGPIDPERKRQIRERYDRTIAQIEEAERQAATEAHKVFLR